MNNFFKQNDNDENTENFTQSGSEFDNITAEKINVKRAEEDKCTTTAASKGLKVFVFALIAVLLLASCTACGYFLGLYNKSAKSADADKELILQSKPGDMETSTAAQIYSDISESVVGILIYNDSGLAGQASGVVYSENGYIITNDHIYDSIPSAKFKIFTFDGSSYDAHYVAGDTRSDIAVLKVNGDEEFKVPKFGDSDEIISGEVVCAIGCPNGYNSRSTVTLGIVSTPKVRHSITSSYSANFIQTDTAINPGSSGGALVNMYGQIIGITSSKISATDYEGVGFAIPSQTVKSVVESLIEYGKVKNRAKLGISYRFYDETMAELQNIAASGLKIEEISEESDLYGKLEVGNIITCVNGTPITRDAVILDILEKCSPDDKLSLTVLTEKGTVTIQVGLLVDEGSSSYEEVESSDNNKDDSSDNGEFDWPEGY